MHVVATAGHVDHGKSTLVQALTGQEPDRLEEEHRRGLSITLGYCWTELPGAGEVAFVDVPGHERFVRTMLAGIGPVPAVLLCVAADDPWMPQAQEHLDALDALGVEHGLLVVTRADLADPAPAREAARQAMAGTSLADVDDVTVSARTSEGLDRLTAALTALVASLPRPDPEADVRLWLDRAFTRRGSGTVVTGTLPAGRIRVDDVLEVGGRTARVRAVQALGRPVDAVTGPARVALNLAGTDLEEAGEGGFAVTPGAWPEATTVDARVTGDEPVPTRPTLHVGALAVPVHARPLADDLVRLRLPRPLPLRVGDRGLLRDAGSRRLWGLRVLDPMPPELSRRGDARRRAEALAPSPASPSVDDELRRRGMVRLEDLRRIGVPAPGADHDAVRAGGWLLRADLGPTYQKDIAARVAAADDPLRPGVPVAVLARELSLPEEVVRALVAPPLRLDEGRVVGPDVPVLPPETEEALARLRKELAERPFSAPAADRLADLGLDRRAVGAAVRAGRLLRLAEGVVLLPGADEEAAAVLRALPQPFTVSEARTALDTSRRVAVPLLELLDKRRLTRRLPDDRRTVVATP